MLMCTVFGSRNAFIPSSPPSLPYPLCFTPPKGVSGTTQCDALIDTVPASTSACTLMALVMLLVYIVASLLLVKLEEMQIHLPPKPYVVLFAISIACSSVSNVLIVKTGPKISSV